MLGLSWDPKKKWTLLQKFGGVSKLGRISEGSYTHHQLFSFLPGPGGLACCEREILSLVPSEPDATT